MSHILSSSSLLSGTANYLFSFSNVSSLPLDLNSELCLSSCTLQILSLFLPLQATVISSQGSVVSGSVLISLDFTSTSSSSLNSNYIQANQILTNSISSGEFTIKLRHTAVIDRVSALQWVSNFTLVSSSPLSTSSSTTSADSTTTASTEHYNTIGVILIALFCGILALVLLIWALLLLNRRRRRKVAIAPESGAESPLLPPPRKPSERQAVKTTPMIDDNRNKRSFEADDLEQACNVMINSTPQPTLHIPVTPPLSLPLPILTHESPPTEEPSSVHISTPADVSTSVPAPNPQEVYEATLKRLLEAEQSAAAPTHTSSTDPFADLLRPLDGKPSAVGDLLGPPLGYVKPYASAPVNVHATPETVPAVETDTSPTAVAPSPIAPTIVMSPAVPTPASLTATTPRTSLAHVPAVATMPIPASMINDKHDKLSAEADSLEKASSEAIKSPPIEPIPLVTQSHVPQSGPTPSAAPSSVNIPDPADVASSAPAPNPQEVYEATLKRLLGAEHAADHTTPAPTAATDPFADLLRPVGDGESSALDSLLGYVKPYTSAPAHMQATTETVPSVESHHITTAAIPSPDPTTSEISPVAPSPTPQPVISPSARTAAAAVGISTREQAVEGELRALRAELQQIEGRIEQGRRLSVDRGRGTGTH